MAVPAAADALDASVARAVRALRAGALVLALAVALALPLTRLYFGLAGQIRSIDIETAQLADELSRRAGSRPDTWTFERNALAQALGNVVLRRGVVAIRLEDAAGQELARAGEWVPGRWIERRGDVLDSGVPVATLHVQSSSEAVVAGALKVAAIGALLGLCIWALIARLALPALGRVFEGLQRARADAETAGRARATFLATMSHEIRTPMNGVIGMTALLQQTRLDRTQAHYVDVIRSSGDALLTVINDILEFSKVESGRLTLEPGVFDPGAIAEDVLGVLGPAANRKRLALLCQVADGTPAWVHADPTRLRQVLLNVVGNAVKFTEAGEVVVQVDAPSPGRLRYVVRDTGIGLSQAQLARIFEPFEQADASITRRFGGTGLGLAISRKLVEQMGGGIEVRSTPGNGATFAFEVDAAPAAAPPETPAQRNLDSLFGQRLLVVDNNATNREILTTLAGHWGMVATAHESPAAALAALDAGGHEADVAVLDFNMPGMNGVELGRELKARRPHLPLVLLSSSQSEAGEAGLFAARLEKPVRRTRLLETLLAVLDGVVDAAPPAWAGADTSTATFDDAAPDGETPRVLVVEDNPVNAFVVRTMLERRGYLSEQAGNGVEALDALQRHRFDLVFMDMQMPELDGLATTRALRRLDLDPQPYVVAFTANVAAEDRDACRAAGMDAFIGKPVSMHEFDRCLDDWIRARAARG